MPRPIDTIETFYAHALAIEHEAAERFAEFAAWFAEHDDAALAGLCRGIEEDERQRFHRLVGGAKGLELPAIEDARYRWLDTGSPDAPAHELLLRVANARQLLQIALDGERSARRFFAWVARTTRHPVVRQLARAMAREESEHLRCVQQALEYREPMLDWERLLAEGRGPGSLVRG